LKIDKNLTKYVATFVTACACAVAFAGEADVIDAKAKKNSDGTYRFDVTIRSKDTGWNYYADAFEVLDATNKVPGSPGKVLGQRILLHPHEDEQPFTRELDSVKIPSGLREVTIRARMKPGGYLGDTFKLKLP
jgi:hypothetical protein